MPAFKPVQNLSQATCGWDKVTNFKSKNKVVQSGGNNYRIVTKEQRKASSNEQLIYKILNVLSLGILSACSKNVKNIITKGKETVRFAIPAPGSPSQSRQTTVNTAAKSSTSAVKSNISNGEAEKKLQSVVDGAAPGISKQLVSIAKYEADIKAAEEKIASATQKLKDLNNKQITEEEVAKRAASDLIEFKKIGAEFSMEKCTEWARTSLNDALELAISRAETEINMHQTTMSMTKGTLESTKKTADLLKQSAISSLRLACLGLSQEASKVLIDEYTKKIQAITA